MICLLQLKKIKKQSEELYNISKNKKLVLYEAIKTAYCPGFKRMLAIAKSGIIGNIKDVDATFTKLIDNYNSREYDINQGGGSVNELASYPLLAIIKLLGTNYTDLSYVSYNEDKQVDIYSKLIVKFNNAIATANIGIGVKKEGELIISGTKGYIYIPAPWWKTEYFEVRFENSQNNQKYYFQFEGDGLRYELSEFLNSILNGNNNISINNEESIKIIEIIEKFNKSI